MYTKGGAVTYQPPLLVSSN